METPRNAPAIAAIQAASSAPAIAAIRAARSDPVIAAVREARDAYTALHGHDVAAIFNDIRALQDASGRAYVRYVRPLAEAVTPVVTQLSETLRLLERSLGPSLQRLRDWLDSIEPQLQEFREWNIVDALNEVGWLPYHSAPFHYVEDCGDDLDLLDRRFSEYYRAGWSEIRDDMASRLEDYRVDDEAKATFREALSAHESGLYRCVCRVLFPEIERMVGAGLRSKRLLEKLTGTGDLADLAFRERFGYVLFGRLVDHAYENVKANRTRFEQDPVPNRNAAMHGLVSYSTHKHSMNMLILTDYIFQILPQDDDPPA